MSRAIPGPSWPGCVNARDLGGLPAAGGRRIRPGALLRSELPPASAAEAISALRPGLIVDLRLPAECETLPSPLSAHPAYRNISVLGPGDPVLERMADTLTGIYRAMLDRGTARISAVLTAVAAAPPGPVLLHCHSGKDRTGVVAALALALAGVPARHIAADYAETARCLSLDDHLAALPDEAARLRSRRLFAEVTPATMLRTLAYLDARYGGPESYLTRAGFTGVAALRARLTSTWSWGITSGGTAADGGAPRRDGTPRG
ncbi:tyrosine-protein phosphatase [Microbispora sp. GKU 823]|uniref:tyrosine-protein phosphatase n=1 Tax=Microbispora sp. GKU 823 TaxID=1652100 RepID=UPI00277B4F1E|nr:tyrosine-protein phosphatase [Microbispora sp. GKU 823]